MPVSGCSALHGVNPNLKKEGTFLCKNHVENMHQKLVPLLILINNPKQPHCLHEILFKI